MAMLIGQLAARLDLNPKTIRYYEHIGVLAEPERTPSGYRVYSEDDVDRLRFVRTAQRFGFKLAEIREILGFRDRGETPCEYVIEVLDRRTAELGAHIEQLQALRHELRQLRSKSLALSDVPDPCVCHLIEDTG